jgi:hypothetical protein
MDHRLRDIMLFSSGLFVLAYETIVSEHTSPTLVGASLTMMLGAPAVYHVLGRFDPKDKDGDK